MSPMQKFAWFNLAVISLTLVLLISLFPFFGYRAMGSMGCLGLTGLSPLFFRKRAGQVLTDERDLLIQQRSWILAYAMFWLVFVLAAVVLSAVVYGPDGAVPVGVVQVSVAWGFMFVYAVASIAILVQYGRGSKDAG
ncbi:MAG: hypothetical protein JWM11_2170 [Planctomycetaceae bacterium]|nr:hypothetical protein [Planctomycetaceae bacterium]